ncbi:T-complex protein 1 subunit beta, partial [Striga asiatica]
GEFSFLHFHAVVPSFLSSQIQTTPPTGEEIKVLDVSSSTSQDVALSSPSSSPVHARIRARRLRLSLRLDVDKILQSTGRGHNVTVTNDGATILKSLHIENAAAKGSTNLESIQIKKPGGSLKDSFMEEGYDRDSGISCGCSIRSVRVAAFTGLVLMMNVWTLHPNGGLLIALMMLRCNSALRSHLEYDASTAPPPQYIERSTSTDIVVLLSKQSMEQKMGSLNVYLLHCQNIV